MPQSTINEPVNTENKTSAITPRTIGIPAESFAGESRVAVTPDVAAKLIKLGFEVRCEANAGAKANIPDSAFSKVGCKTGLSSQEILGSSDIILKVRPPEQSEIAQIKSGTILISFIWPGQNSSLVQELAKRGISTLAMDAVPRISRAQKLDALSSMSNISGYRAVIEAANNFGRFFNGQITAAGKVAPAQVLIIGAGVAGLAAIAAARGLGAIVRAFDTRPAVKEQVESLGASFLEVHLKEDGSGVGGYAKEMSKEFIEAEMALFAQQAKEVDVIITTALIPGKPAPKLITKVMVESMKDGSVIVDLASEQGGNCELTKPGQVYKHNGVTIVGLTDLPSRMANQASQLYGNNLCHLIKEMGEQEQFTIDLNNEVVRGTLVTHDGQVTWPPPARPAAAPTSNVASVAPIVTSVKKEPTLLKRIGAMLLLIVSGMLLLGLGLTAPDSFLSHLTVFVLACFVGWQVIWNVTPALHTPLMSVTNAISGIIIVGGMLQISGPLDSLTTILGAIAIFVGTINISGGFLVTQRMLKMFRK